MKRIGITIAMFGLLALASCKKKDEAPPAPSPVATAGSGSAAMGSGSAAMTTGSAAPAAPAKVDVPTEQDFEKQAADKITDKNVDQQVKQIESDLGQAP